mmetsp:Transcript_34708/g.25847  ORF Transcript_34708/g.25847 Transcript_34708/m.25847 type:complete len:132 (+) Transcript_34708:497-892(+)
MEKEYANTEKALNESMRSLSSKRGNSNFPGSDLMLIKSGYLRKRKGLRTKRVRVTLTNQPRLYMLDEKDNYKGDFLISQNLKAIWKDKTKFEVHCSASNKTVVFKVDQAGDDTKVWVHKINRVIEIHTRNV